MTLVIDASAAFKLLVEEPGSEQAIALVANNDVVAPALIHAEIANALWKRVQRGELVADDEMEERLADMGRYIRTLDEREVMPDALRIALELRHPVYDCVYLALAESIGADLHTCDARFLRAVAATDYRQRVKELGT